jgi:NADH dehydrogenase
MAMTRKVATVFGGSGFLGRYVVQRLAAQGYVVRVAVRDTEAALFLKPMGAVGQVVPLYAPVEQKPAIQRAVEDAEIVVNLVGILAEQRRLQFYHVHKDGAERIARLSAAAGVRHLVHVSALAADVNADSHYARSKGQGELAVRENFPNAVILRPSILFGAEDRFFNRFANLAMLSMVVPIVGGSTKLQPVYVGDVAAAVLAAATGQAAGQIVELGGPDVKTFRELIEYTLKIVQRHRLIWDMPLAIARLNAAILQHLPGKLLTPDQVKLLRRDNIVAGDALDLASLGITPTPLDMVVPNYLARFRSGGQRQPVFRT